MVRLIFNYWSQKTKKKELPSREGREFLRSWNANSYTAATQWASFSPPLRCQCSVFPVQNPRQSRTDALLEGSNNFQESAFSGTFSSPHTFCTPPYYGPRKLAPLNQQKCRQALWAGSAPQHVPQRVLFGHLASALSQGVLFHRGVSNFENFQEACPLVAQSSATGVTVAATPLCGAIRFWEPKSAAIPSTSPARHPRLAPCLLRMRRKCDRGVWRKL